MTTSNVSLGKTRSFFFARLGITIPYYTAIERIFLEACSVDPTIKHILRIPPYSSHPGALPNPRRITPSFVVVRTDGTEAVVLLNSSFVSPSSLERIDKIEAAAAHNGWRLKVWLPASPSIASAYRKADKKRAGR